MKKETQYILIVSFSIFLYFLLNYYNFSLQNTVPLFIIMCSNIYYNKYLQYRKNSLLYLLISISITLILNFLFISKGLDFFSLNKIIDGIIVSVITFFILKYFIYE